MHISSQGPFLVLFSLLRDLNRHLSTLLTEPYLLVVNKYPLIEVHTFCSGELFSGSLFCFYFQHVMSCQNQQVADCFLPFQCVSDMLTERLFMECVETSTFSSSERLKPPDSLLLLAVSLTLKEKEKRFTVMSSSNLSTG